MNGYFRILMPWRSCKTKHTFLDTLGTMLSAVEDNNMNKKLHYHRLIIGPFSSNGKRKDYSENEKNISYLVILIMSRSHIIKIRWFSGRNLSTCSWLPQPNNSSQKWFLILTLCNNEEDILPNFFKDHIQRYPIFFNEALIHDTGSGVFVIFHSLADAEGISKRRSKSLPAEEQSG